MFVSHSEIPESDGCLAARSGKKYLYRLFHGGPVLKACRLGGVPLPENCVDPSFGTAF